VRGRQLLGMAGHSHSRPHWRLFAGGIICLVGLFGGLGYFAVQSPVLTQRLPDGTTWRLVEASYAGEVFFRPEPLWKTVLSPFFGASSRWSVPPPGYYPLQIILESDSQAWGQSATGVRGRNVIRMQHVEIVDEDGDRLGPANAFERNNRIEVHSEVFPRRGRRLKLRFSEEGASEPAAGLSILNPLFDDYPIWEPEPLPALRRRGPVSVTLLEMRPRVVREGAGPSDVTYRDLVLDVRENGKPSPNWQPVGLEIEDATGNQVRHDTPAIADGDRWRFPYKSLLSERESAWKLKVEVARRARAPFPAGHQVTLGPFPAPRRGVVVPLGLDVTIAGERVRLVSLHDGDRQWRKPRLELERLSAWEGKRLTVLARDERGRDYAGYDWMGGQAVAPWEHLQLNLAPEARRLWLTVAIQEGEFFEFHVSPAGGGSE
jgi:hypothetical protein